MKKVSFFTITALLLLGACKTTKPTETAATTKPAETPKPAANCGTTVITYTADIKPILEQYCTRCHGDAGGYDLQSMADITRAAKNGDLLGTIKWQPGHPKMPARADQLDAATINKIECWINNGMKQ